MCDLLAIRDALDAWLIPDVARIECLRELRLPKDIDYDEVGDNGTPYHITKITLKLSSLCMWRAAVLRLPRLGRSGVDRGARYMGAVSARFPRDRGTSYA